MRFYTQADVQQFEQVTFLRIKAVADGHLLRIRLNRPEKRNAFDQVMAEEIIFALAYAHYQSEIRCVVVEAEGPVFCAGADLQSFYSNDFSNQSLPRIKEEARLGDAFAEVFKPCIALVQGPVLAGGFLIICGCHFVISVPEVTFSLPEVKRGIWPMQVMASLSKILLPRKILEMCMTGRSYTAAEMLQSGLVTDIFEKDEIALKVNALATQIVENAPLAVGSGLKAFQEFSYIPLERQHAFLKEALDKLLQSEDAKEGIAAFKETRKPVWKGC